MPLLQDSSNFWHVTRQRTTMLYCNQILSDREQLIDSRFDIDILHWVWKSFHFFYFRKNDYVYTYLLSLWVVMRPSWGQNFEKLGPHRTNKNRQISHQVAPIGARTKRCVDSWDQPSSGVEDLISNLPGLASLSGDFLFIAAITLVETLVIEENPSNGSYGRIFEW